MFAALAPRRIRSVVDRITDWTRATSSLLIPASCAFCGHLLDSDLVVPQLCLDCEGRFSPVHPACARCGYIFRHPGTSYPSDGAKCPECAGRRFAFDAVVALGAYEGALADAVVRMKYEGGQPLAFALGRHLAQHLQNSGRGDCYDFVACATKHWTKRIVTGINSPEVIMQGLAGRANLPHAASLLVCRRRIRKQSMLSPLQRRQNVKHAWAVSPQFDIQGARILLVDDILTTGATAHAMARVLKQKGATHVSMAVVGRATK